MPAGDLLLEVVIDDLIVAAKVPRGLPLAGPHGEGRADRVALRRAAAGYRASSMPGAPEKDQLNQSTMTAAGLEVDGFAGFGGPPRDRLLPLCLLSLFAARLPLSTTEFMEVMNGTWTSCALSRRPLLTLMDRVYKVVGMDRKGAVALPRTAAQEYVLLALVAPLIAVDLRAPYSEDLYATDASPFGGGVTCVRGAFPPGGADAAWRNRERKGGYSRLENPIMENAIALGLVDDLSPDFGFEDWKLLAPEMPRRPAAQRWDVLGLFAMDERMKAIFHRLGLRLGPIVSPTTGAFYDLTSEKCLDWLVYLIQNCRVRFWILSLPSCVLGSALRRSARSGVGEHLWRTTLWLLKQLRTRCIPFLLVLPPSVLPGGEQVQALRRAGFEELSETFACGFGSPFLGRRMLLGSHCDASGLVRPCPGCRVHLPEGKDLEDLSHGWWPTFCLAVGKVVQQTVGAAQALEDPYRVDGPQRPWVNAVSRAGGWTVLDEWTWDKGGHINILEMKTERRLIMALCRAGITGRVNCLQDSRVTILSGAKGRSSSRAVRAQLCLSMPYHIGGNLYVGRHYVPSKLMTADDPSRGVMLRPPTADLPGWWTPHDEGGRPPPGDADWQRARFTRWLAVPPGSKAFADWARFALLLEERDPRGWFVGTELGPAYCSNTMADGPRVGSTTRTRDLPALPDRKKLAPGTIKLRDRCLWDMSCWLISIPGAPDLPTLVLRPAELNIALEAYGRALYRYGRPHGDYAKHYIEHHRPSSGTSSAAEPGLGF